MFSRIAREEGLSGQHLEEATQAAPKRHFARRAVFMGFPATQLGQELYFGPVEADAQVEEKACRDPGQGDEGADAPQIEQLHLFPAQAGFQEFETVLHTPALPVHGKDAHGTGCIGDRPIGEQQPRLPVHPQHAYLHQPHVARDQLAWPLATHIRPVAQAQRAGGQVYLHRLLLGSHLLAALDLQRRFDARQRAQLGRGLRDIALVPRSLPILPGDLPIRMIKA